ncbi:TetR/AcrR family transcriptional regulator [Woodsholea maritima]|uniref:TetR/AcrR family transcriptional regulator n=1 Tax=Woodsholea maritima TaxID=240237 RepID=UPI00036728E6|nr:TetR/AcrR family transcriptional regulator [Woodsholea maritima]
MAIQDNTARRITRRDQRREATKVNVIEAARKVFLERGYEGATIKAIADEAGVSPGTVLNAAPSKASLLVEILKEEYQAILDSSELLDAALSGAVIDKLVALLQVSFEAQSRHPELFAAAVGHSWLWTDPAYDESYKQMDLSWEPITRTIRRGVDSGELRQDLDIEEVRAMLQDIYLGVFRRANRQELGSNEVSRIMRTRLQIFFNGLTAK